MGAAGIIVGIFLIFSLGISWVSGDRQRARIENRLQDEQAAKINLERDLNTATAQINNDNEQISDLTERLRDQITERVRLEKELASMERQQRMTQEQGGVAASPDMEKEREKIRAELEAKSKEEIARLESRLAASEEARKKAEDALAQGTGKEEYAKRAVEEALKKYEAALNQAEARLKNDGVAFDESVSTKFKDIHSTLDKAIPAGLISVTVSKQLNSDVKELETILAQARKNRLALKGMIVKASARDLKGITTDASAGELVAGKTEREGAQFSTEQLQKDMKAANGDEFKERVAGLEERLISLKDDKKVINERWDAAMTAIVNMEETSQKIENLLKTSDKGDLKTLGTSEEKLKFQTDIEALRKSREDMRQAMEKVKSAISASLDAETKRVLAESSVVSGKLDVMFAEGRFQGKGKDLAAVMAAKQSLAAEDLKEEQVDMKAEKKIQALGVLAKNVGASSKQGGVAVAGVTQCTDGSLDVYIVKKGDSLSTIASKKEIYGNENMWPILYKYNLFTVIGPDTIEPDMRLFVKRDTRPDEAADARRRSVARGKWLKQTPHMKDWIMDWTKTNGTASKKP